MEATSSFETSADLQQSTSVISQKVELFIITAASTPNSTWIELTFCSKSERSLVLQPKPIQAFFLQRLIKQFDVALKY
jgi:hypothetical protein